MKLTLKMKALFATLFVGIFALLATAFAASTPVPPGGSLIESGLGVLNTTNGETTYNNSTNANFDEVVNVMVYVHNREATNSGKDAQNVVAKVSIPGAKTTDHTLTSTVGGSNTNIETLNAHVISNEASVLSYIPGSAIRTYNAGTNANPNWTTVRIDDSIVGNGYNLGTVHPCCNFQESIVFQARIMVPTISITKQVKIDGVGTWADSVQAQPGDTLNYLITIKNDGNTTLNNVMVRDSMPPLLQFIPGSATLINGAYPNGYPLSDLVVQGGVNTGTYLPGIVEYVRLQARVPGDNSACNMTHTNVAHAVEPTVGDFLNNASVVVICQQVREARVRIVKFNDMNGNHAQDAGEPNLAGWQFIVTGPNGFNQTVTTDSSGTSLITGLAAGNYTVTEVAKSGWVNTTGTSLTQSVALGETRDYVFGNQQTTPNVVPPTTLPSSGPAEMFGMLLGAGTISGGTLSYIRSRKNLKKAALKR